MKKMIGVINDNLASVVDGIRSHKEEAEEKLNEINAEIDKKVKDAGTYRTQVDHARSSIQSLENDITSLKNDLKELKDKFGSRNFVEIINAADREINAKIEEKQQAIDVQTNLIKSITDDANNLKDVLVKLKEKKASIEETLKNAKILYAFYEKRINDIIGFSNDHVEDLGKYTDVDDKPISDIDVEQALSKVDGSIFEEIDTISSKAPTEEEAQIALDNIIDLDDEDEEEKVDLTATQQLDDIILTAKDLLGEDAVKKEEKKEEEPPIYATPVPFRQPEPVEAEKVPKDIKLPDGPLILDTSFDALRDKEKESILDKKMEEHPPVPVDGTQTSYVDFNDILDKALKDAEEFIGPDTEEVPFTEVKEEVVQHDSSLNDLNGDLDDKNDKTTTKEDIIKAFKELNLDAGRFTDSDLEKLLLPFNKDNTDKFVTVLGNHGIDVQVIYENVDVLIKVTPQNLDKILSLLEITGASPEAIGFVYRYFDRISVSKLEIAIVPGENKELSHVLFDAIPFFTEDNLVDRLGLTKQEEYILKDKTTKEEFKRMCMFSDIVFANYVTLRSLGINNLKDCITKHPKRFLWNPDRFNAMLDKYDTDDLIRCINKNSAVLDKL